MKKGYECIFQLFYRQGCRGRDRMVVELTTVYVSLDPAHGEVYSVQHYVISLLVTRFLHQ